MPVTRSDIPNLLTSGLKTVFFDAYESGLQNAQYTRIATVVPSGKDQETYGWLGAIPTMREWKDERMPKGLLEHNYTIINKDWEVSIGVHKNAIEDDQYGQVRIRTQELGSEAARHKDQLVFELLAAGFATDCYDGQYFFDTDHSEGDSGTQSNKGTTALGADSLAAGVTAMMKYKDDKGKPLGIVPDTLVIPPDLWMTACEILESLGRSDTANNTTNAFRYLTQLGLAKLNIVMSPYLTDTNDWFLLCTNKIVKPIILQERQEVRFGALESTSDRGFMRKEYVYGADARYNVGYGLWQCAYGASVT